MIQKTHKKKTQDLNALDDWADRVAQGAASARILVHL